MGTIRIVLPLPPNLGNARMHWRVRHKNKKLYYQLADNMVIERKNPKPPAAPYSGVVLYLWLYTWNPMDMDNLNARCKFAIDWLVSRGYLEDDSPKHVTWGDLPGQSIDRDNPRIEILIEGT